MRFMMIVKATKTSEAGTLPSEAELVAMGKFNEELVKSGAMLAGEGLHASSKGARVRFANGKPTPAKFARPKKPFATESQLNSDSRRAIAAEMLSKGGLSAEAADEFEHAAGFTKNERERAALRNRGAAAGRHRPNTVSARARGRQCVNEATCAFPRVAPLRLLSA